MAFGQQSGPPASHRDVARLLELLAEAGHTDFRDARGPLQLTQRQAGGKFTRDEAAELIERLEAEAELARLGQAPDDDAPPREPVRRLTAAERAVRDLPTEVLAAELQRRGWIAVEP